MQYPAREMRICKSKGRRKGEKTVCTRGEYYVYIYFYKKIVFQQ